MRQEYGQLQTCRGQLVIAEARCVDAQHTISCSGVDGQRVSNISIGSLFNALVNSGIVHRMFSSFFPA